MRYNFADLLQAFTKHHEDKTIHYGVTKNWWVISLW